MFKRLQRRGSPGIGGRPVQSGRWLRGGRATAGFARFGRADCEHLEPRVLLSSVGIGSLTETASTEVAVSLDTEAEGGAQLLPDLFAWSSESKRFIHGWHLDVTEIPGRTLLRLATTMVNIGEGPLEVRGGDSYPDGTQDVFQRIYNADSSFTDRLAGTFTFHSDHDHFHLNDFATYTLREVTEGNGVGDVVAGGDKTSYCLLDSTRYDTSLSGAPDNRVYEAGSCEDPVNGVQGISAGWGDLYLSSLPDQWIDVTELVDGTYWLEVTVDPNDRLLESDETNNATRIMVELSLSGQIHGTKWEDIDRDGVFEPQNGEVGLEGWTIFLDTDEDGELDVDELRTVTDANGEYIFTDLDSGIYVVAEVWQEGWEQISPVPQLQSISTKRVAEGLSKPVYVTAPSGDAQRLFIVEQHTGHIEILNLDTELINPAPYLDIEGLGYGYEQGLLGLAFDPNYAANGFFYVYLTVTGDATHVRRYQVSSDPDVADPTTATTILTYDQPMRNHNGGWLGFGPDDLLYISSGDGGGRDDKGFGHTADIGNSQDITDNLLGKILRIDVHGDDFPDDVNRNYAIPSTNPFVGIDGDDEIWAYGLRNPWRPSFDRGTGDFYIADVGQDAREEINFQPVSSLGGENYGWRLREGLIETPSGSVGGDRPQGAVDPIYEYNHGFGQTEGLSVSGGYVYRGPIQDLQGRYFFADYVTERIWSIEHDGTASISFTDHTTSLPPDVGTIDAISSFGEDALGNLYIVDLGGEIFKIIHPSRPGSHKKFVVSGETVENVDFGSWRFQNDGDRLDYGDAIDYPFLSGYPTLLVHDGARHVFNAAGPLLGSHWDAEPDGQPGINANGDDTDGSDDEDGVQWLSDLQAGSSSHLQVTVSNQTGYLNGWIDFNADGDWADSGEQILTDHRVVPGVHDIVVHVPSDAAHGTAFARFRVNLNGNLSHDGLALNGEVEDYVVFIGPDTTGPQVVEVAISGSNWTSSFLDHLGVSGKPGGYRIPTGSDAQLDVLPWGGVDQIHITFSEDVNVQLEDLELFGINVADHELLSFEYDPTRLTASWTMAAPLGTDKLLVKLSGGVQDRAGNALDGEWQDQVSTVSGDGEVGGLFLMRLNALPGDVDQDEVTSIFDVGSIHAAMSGSVSSDLYSVFRDLNADASVDLNDALALRDHLGQRLPSGEPSGSAEALASPVFAEREGDRQVRLASWFAARTAPHQPLGAVRGQVPQMLNLNLTVVGNLTELDDMGARDANEALANGGLEWLV